MLSQTGKQKALAQAISKLLRPIVRMLLRNSMPFATFEALAKRAYVEVALEEFAIAGKKPTISRASVLSGLTRKEVQRLVATAAPGDGDEPEFHNRATRVLTAWAREPRYRGADAKPRRLEVDGKVSFADLVRRHSGDMPARAVMDELLRVGAIRRAPGGQLALVQRAYVPAQGQLEKLAMLGTDVADLIETIDHNVEHGADDARFQRKVLYRDMPAAAIPAFRKVSAAKAQALLEQMDGWLARRAAAPEAAADLPRARIGLGIFQIEQVSGPAGRGEGAP